MGSTKAKNKGGPPTVTATEANTRIGYLISRAVYAGERTIIERRGKPIAVIVPFTDLEILEKHAPAA